VDRGVMLSNPRTMKPAEKKMNIQPVILCGCSGTRLWPLSRGLRLANPGTILLEIIEVQSGSYLGEDDIVRFEDNYGRST